MIRNMHGTTFTARAAPSAPGEVNGAIRQPAKAASGAVCRCSTAVGSAHIVAISPHTG
jgi:hypothetical protein